MPESPLDCEQTTERKQHFVGTLLTSPVGWLLAWGTFFGIAAALYWPALHAPYFSDDFLFFFTNPPAHLYEYFFRVGAAIHAYRPLEAIILTVTQQHLGFETLPIHLSALACHAGLVCVVLSAARRLRFGVFETTTACAVMLFSQIGTSALLGNDTLSQSASAFFGCYAAYLLWRAGKTSWLSILLFGISLFFKETAFGFLLVIAFLTVFVSWKKTTGLERFRSACFLLIPYMLATGVYLMGRHLAGGTLASHGRYGMHVGANILLNLVSFTLAAFSPVSTVTTAIALSSHHKSVLLLSLGAIGCILITVVAGIFFSRQRALIGYLLLLAIASLFPTFLLEHVSELYVYNALPFITLVLGIAFGALWRRNKAARVISVGVVLVFLAGQVLAVRQKSGLMDLNGRRAAKMIASINGYVQQLPRNSQVKLVRSATNAPTYSVFVLNGFDVLDFGNIELGTILKRPDVRIDIIDEREAQHLTPGDHLLLLGLDKNSTIERYTPSKPDN